MIIDGRKIAEEVVEVLLKERDSLPHMIRLGVVMSEGDAATESFVRIKERVAGRLQVEVVREILPEDATMNDAIAAVNKMVQETQGVIVQLPLPDAIDTNTVLRALPSSHDVDAVGPGRQVVLPPVAEAISEIFARENISAQNKKAVVVGAGRLVGAPAARLLRDMGAEVTVVTQTEGSLSELKDADIVVLGAGKSGMVKPSMLKEGVVLIDAGTSEQGGRVMGDADPACAEVASIFTPVPGGVGPIAVAMIFKNLLTLIRAAQK